MNKRDRARLRLLKRRLQHDCIQHGLKAGVEFGSKPHDISTFIITKLEENFDLQLKPAARLWLLKQMVKED